MNITQNMESFNTPNQPAQTKRQRRRYPIRKVGWFELIAILLSVWFVLYPKPYKVLLAILLLIPIVGLVLNGFRKAGLASLVFVTPTRNDRNRYDVADYLDIAAWAILIRVILDYEFDSLRSMILPGAIAFVTLLAMLFFTHRQFGKTSGNKTWIYVLLIFNICLYSYAGTYAANCAFDFSEPAAYPTEVLDKRISKGRRSTTYYVKIAPWGHHFDKEEISIPLSEFNELAIGDKINIDLKQGLFNIPWYYIEKK